jgi:hypothetical protein
MGHIGKGPNQNICRPAQNYGIPFSPLWAAISKNGAQRVNHNIAVCFSKRTQLLAFGGICFFWGNLFLYDSPGAKAYSRSMKSKRRYSLSGGE